MSTIPPTQRQQNEPIPSSYVWPPPPRLKPPTPMTAGETRKYRWFWLIENSICFLATFFVGVISWGYLSIPLLLIALLTVRSVKSYRAKCAALGAAWGAGVVAFLLLVSIVYDNLDVH